MLLSDLVWEEVKLSSQEAHPGLQILPKHAQFLTLIPTAVTIYGSHYFKAKFLKNSLNNINLKKIANP
jgi:hypothetical protein